MKKILCIALLAHLMFVSSISSASIPKITYQPYSSDAIKLSKKLLKLKDKYHLKFKDEKDLQETCHIICEYAKYSKFNKYEIASVVLWESRYDQYAVSPCGARGLGQTHNIKKDYKEELFWVKNQFDKHQNLTATIIILQDKLKSYKTKHMALVRYNGKVCKNSRTYADLVIKTKNEIKDLKT